MLRPILLLLLALAPAAPAADLLPNFHPAAPGIYRGGRPDGPEAYARLKKLGIRTIINLQGDPAIAPFAHGETKASRSEARRQAEEAGIRSYYNLPVYATRVPGKDELDVYSRLLAVMADPHQQPVYVHCNLGNDRTGFLIALYRVLYQGCPYQAAHEEMLRSGGPFTPVFTTLLLPTLSQTARNGDARAVEPNRCPL